MSAAVTGPSPLFDSLSITWSRLCSLSTTPFRLSRTSTTSSCTPSSAEYSCSTPVILTSVGAYPGIDDRSTRRSALPSVCPYPRSNGSITTLAWNGDMLCTSMMRGFNRTLVCMRYLYAPVGADTKFQSVGRWRRWSTKRPAATACHGRRLLRVELDHQAFVDVLRE